MMVKGIAIGIYLTVVCDAHVSAPHTVPTLQKHGKILIRLIGKSLFLMNN